MNAISWMDTRGAKYAKSITDGLIKIEGYGITKLLAWLSLTGGIPGHSGKDSIAHILYIKNELPDIYLTSSYNILFDKSFNAKFIKTLGLGEYTEQYLLTSELFVSKIESMFDNIKNYNANQTI